MWTYEGTIGNLSDAEENENSGHSNQTSLDIMLRVKNLIFKQGNVHKESDHGKQNGQGVSSPMGNIKRLNFSSQNKLSITYQKNVMVPSS